MAVDEPDRIDIIAHKPGSSEVLLIISDHLDWSDPHGHALLLQAKVNTYLAFVESDQFRDKILSAVPGTPELCIAVRALHAVPAQAGEFLARVESFLGAEGIRFDWART